MNITFDLPLLKTDGVEFNDNSLKYDGYSLDLWDDKDLEKVATTLEATKDIFFQTEASIDDEFLEQLNIDTHKFTLIIVNLLFVNLQRVEAVRTHLNVRYDEVEPKSEARDNVSTYKSDGEEYIVYNNDELIIEAREYVYNRLGDTQMEDILGQVEYITDFFDVIDVKKFANEIRDKISNDELSVFDDIWDNDEEIIKWMAGEDEDFILEKLGRYFDYEKASVKWVSNTSEAVSEVEGYIGELVWSDDILLDGFKQEHFFVYRMH